jgi:hypothetical protein
MPRKPPVPPTCFVPSCAGDFVGQAGKVAEEWQEVFLFKGQA